MKGNVFAALRALDNEDVISNLLAYCVNHSPSFASHFMSALPGRRWDGYDEVDAYTRKSLPGVGIPDLIVKGRSRGKCDLVVIENKLMAEEGRDQTKRYADEFCAPNPQNSTFFANLEPRGEWDAPRLVFLTLFPWQAPGDCRFRHVTYEQLLPALKPYERGQDAVADRLFCDLSDAYSAFYASGCPDPRDILMDKWSSRKGQECRSGGNLDTACLHFGNVFASKEMKYPLGLKARPIGRLNKLGRPFYAAQISKDTWHPPVAEGRLGFNIHFEPQFALLDGKFALYLHYEVREYLPRKQAEKLYREKLQEHDEARRRFIEHLRETRPPGLMLGGGRNQVGKVPVKPDQRTTLGEFSQTLCSAIATIAKVIDDFLLR